SALSNDFDYGDDPSGKHCPLQAHVRLSNPRIDGKNNALATPRIARRGFSYDDGSAGRGLMFMAYNASITSQYETIQRWLNAGNITGLFSWQNDFLTGPVSALPFPHAYGHSGISSPHGSGPCVKLRWGLYLFVPSKKAIEWLSHHKPEPAPDVRGGHELIERLRTLALRRPTEAVQEWKRFIEDPAYDRQARAIWAAIRDCCGELDTPYGRLVATEAGARHVLQDDGSRFSVREYGVRLNDTLAPHYLGMDTYTADFAQLAAADKLFHDTLTPQIAKESALRIARDVLAQHTISNSDGRKTLWIEKDFAKKVVRKLAEEWFFGEPPAPNDVWFDHVVDVSRYAFQPHPAASLAALLRNQRNTIPW
ncbi:MAG TPA: hypothetical protein VMF89_02545, partial [Polyangiales bacterium]|nr:hypothetical protein [Polyangiales bacterium]